MEENQERPSEEAPEPWPSAAEPVTLAVWVMCRERGCLVSASVSAKYPSPPPDPEAAIATFRARGWTLADGRTLCPDHAPETHVAAPLGVTVGLPILCADCNRPLVLDGTGWKHAKATR